MPSLGSVLYWSSANVAFWDLARLKSSLKSWQAWSQVLVKTWHVLHKSWPRLYKSWVEYWAKFLMVWLRLLPTEKVRSLPWPASKTLQIERKKTQGNMSNSTKLTWKRMKKFLYCPKVPVMATFLWPLKTNWFLVNMFKCCYILK